MINYLQYLLGYAEFNEYEADAKSKRQKYLCCEIIKNSNITLKKVNNDCKQLRPNKKKRIRKV